MATHLLRSFGGTSSKKEHECDIVRRLFAILEPGTLWTFEPGEGPDDVGPDIVAFAVGRTIGVEHTDVFWPLSAGKHRQELEALRERLVSEARLLWLKSRRPHVNVTMTFFADVRLRSRQVPAIAERLIALVARNVPPRGRSVELERTIEGDDEWPATVDSLSIDRLIDYDTTCFGTMEAAFLPELSQEHLQEAIESKSAKRHRYRSFTENWLVLAIHTGPIADAFGPLTRGTRDAVYRSTFERVFLFEASCDRHWELQLCAKPQDERSSGVNERALVPVDTVSTSRFIDP